MLAWLLAWTPPAFLAYGWDKRQAQRGGWRVPELFLHALALVGGVIGAWAGRAVFRHKTQKPVFLVVLIAASVLWAAIVGLGHPVSAESSSGDSGSGRLPVGRRWRAGAAAGHRPSAATMSASGAGAARRLPWPSSQPSSRRTYSWSAFLDALGDDVQAKVVAEPR